LAMLERLGAMAMHLAEITHGQAIERAAAEQAAGQVPAAPGQTSAAELTLVFTRVARAVRLTVAFEARLACGRETRRASATGERQQPQKLNVKRAVARVIDAAEGDPSETADWYEALDGGIEALDEREIAERPLGELVERVCRDLGVGFDRDAWEAENAAGAEDDAVAAAPPLANGAPVAGAWVAGTCPAMTMERTPSVPERRADSS